MSKSMNTLGLTLAAAAVLAAAAPASAQSLNEQASVTVRYGDLNLDHAAGAKALLYRIKIAAKIACSPIPEMGRWDEVRAFDACRKAAIDRAVAKVGSPILTAMADVDAHPVRLATR
jgi:UrcA family protein